VGVKTGRCLGDWNISTLVNSTRMEKMAYKEGDWATPSIFLLSTRVMEFTNC
jgi:hypothetical protein